jgi:hypothetical protein
MAIKRVDGGDLKLRTEHGLEFSLRAERRMDMLSGQLKKIRSSAISDASSGSRPAGVCGRGSGQWKDR